MGLGVMYDFLHLGSLSLVTNVWNDSTGSLSLVRTVLNYQNVTNDPTCENPPEADPEDIGFC